ncbi:lamin tail domain-containing protein [Longimicrobium terrae]|uniref:Endonuclease/exonuclease/phosphatase family metal-dependent hydrolase n=1 Tax=Longimicrobium terrae TaxID=1639882 RepID=A0A841H171_9BACT|nr:lamin tail domain-containing protein [Longimicrobium terrae]MBB4637355.1 endonuclease/exonuclease/phosphatase family metal-dependent hydrolase [Longimicrobium terrae]MBB6071753.1 endonuclease/exonuclease/phosphatase family metal-dependent hydrolase [Longimicrobium terrae]
MRLSHSPRALLLLTGLLGAPLAACDTPSGVPRAVPADGAARVVIPAKGTASTLDVGSWNIEWFGDASNGPANETLQLSNARDVIGGADLDIWGVAEIVSQTQFNTLESQLSGYSGVLASESTVTNGSTYYAASEQKVGILYRSSIATLLGAKVILTANDADFAGRPPLEARLRVTLNGATEDIVVIVLHMKAFDDLAGWTRRQAAGTALKSYIDTTWPTQKVIVVGDWNDDVDTSITSGQASPYQNFVSDAADYLFPTRALSLAGIASTTGYSDMIDHHLVTNDLSATYVANSAQVYRVDSYISSYASTTSDHYPVLSRYTFGSGGGSTAGVTVTAPNGGESWAAGSARSITWTSTGVTNLKLEYTLNGSTWSVITASTPASAGSYAWTVPSTTSTTAKVRVTDASVSTRTDASDGVFSITASSTPASVTVNEIMANEPGSTTAAEYVEIVNLGGTSASIGGWTLSDAAGVKHTFAAGTTLAAGKAIVVFGGAAGIPVGLANAVSASTGTLALGNSGDSVILKDGSGVVKFTYAYPSSLAGTDGVSMNRSPDASATGSWVLHTALGSLSSSPGVRANGVAF